MRRRTPVLAGLLVALVAAAAAYATSGFDTAKPSYLTPLEPGVAADPILSTGDTIGGYQMSGIPDGLGAYRDGGAIQVLMNHELAGGAPAGVGARISKVTLDPETRTVLGAEYVFTGDEGFLRFCSSTLERIQGEPLYFTGEESTNDGHLTPAPGDGLGWGGSSIVLNADTGEWTETRHFGLLPHENNVPVERLSQAFVLVGEDGEPPPGNESQLYAYIAKTWDGAISGDEGSLHVWQADAGQTDADPSTNDISAGETLSGRFVPVSQTENATAATLETAAQAKQGFDFVRVEDAAVAQQRPGRLYFVDTGAAGTESVRGRLYRLDVDPSDPTEASLTLLLDGDAGGNLVNPDNLDASAHSVVINEDRNSEHRDAAPPYDGYGRVLVYDIKSGEVRVVARAATPPPLRQGEWESSGVIDAQTLLGEGWWLIDVQAHRSTALQPGPTLAPNSSTGEGGQLLALRIPNS